jgi:tRNA A-37 threonylcarbamoyl transferase component Bud32
MIEEAVERLLDERSVLSYVRDRGLLDGAPATASVLRGGVSNVVLAVDDGRRRVVVKQSLGRLRVRDEWHAPRERVMAEAAALDAARGLTATRVPMVVDRDPERHVVVIEAAPEDWRDWKTQLLRGDATPALGRNLGEVLGRWHRLTVGSALPAEVEGQASFEVLRLEPYYRTAARRQPALSDQILSLAEELSSRRVCLVHGDFSPKNVLVDPTADGESLWVIDFEVAHRGDPAFDVAFLASHLILKSIHRPAWAPLYDACLRAFATAYVAEVRAGAESAASPLTPRWPYLLSHVGALLVARVVGRSPAEYLTPQEQRLSLGLGADLLREPPDGLDGLFDARARLAA